MGSDGVFEFIENDEIIEMVEKCSRPKDACKLLIDESRKRWLIEEGDVIDDCTVVVIFLTFPACTV